MEDPMGDINLAKLTKPDLIEKVETARNIWRADQETIQNLNHQINRLEKFCADQKQAIAVYNDLFADLLTNAAVAARHTADIKMKLKPYAKTE